MDLGIFTIAMKRRILNSTEVSLTVLHVSKQAAAYNGFRVPFKLNRKALVPAKRRDLRNVDPIVVERPNCSL